MSKTHQLSWKWGLEQLHRSFIWEDTLNCLFSKELSLYRDFASWDSCYHLKRPSLSLHFLPPSLRALRLLPSLLERRVKPLGNNGDIFKEPSVAERTAWLKPRRAVCWISAHTGDRGIKMGDKFVCAHTCTGYCVNIVYEGNFIFHTLV